MWIHWLSSTCFIVGVGFQMVAQLQFRNISLYYAGALPKAYLYRWNKHCYQIIIIFRQHHLTVLLTVDKIRINKANSEDEAQVYDQISTKKHKLLVLDHSL